MDAFAVKQLVKLEEKVPSIKTETGEVLEALSERKNAVYSTITHGKEALTGHLTSGKDAITTRLTNGKDAISSTISSSKEAVCNRIQASSDALANTRAGSLVGCGVNCTLTRAENLVDYLLPEDKKEDTVPKVIEEEFAAETKEELSGEESGDEEEEVEEGEGEGCQEVAGESRVVRVKNLSRKVKKRIYHRTLRRLDSLQQQCKTGLEQIKEHVDLVGIYTYVHCISLNESMHNT